MRGPNSAGAAPLPRPYDGMCIQTVKGSAAASVPPSYKDGVGGGKDRGRESEAGAASRERDAVGAGRNRARDNIREGAVSGTEGSEHLTAPEAPRLILGAKIYDASLGDRGAGGKGHPGSVAGNHGSGGAGTRKPNVCKFVTERFRFVGGGEALKLLSENTDFTVIAAIGLAGCGKSALMNELANSGARGAVEGGGCHENPLRYRRKKLLWTRRTRLWAWT